MSEAVDESSRHLATLDRDQRRSAGVVYTPDALVELVLDQELGAQQPPLGPTLDPCCGAGQFTTAIVARIAGDMIRRGQDVASPRWRRRFLAEVERLVWACDVDAGAVGVALGGVRRLIEGLAPGPLSTDFMSRNIVVGDFLADGAPAVCGGFRHVVGNPPYVPVDRLGAADLLRFRGAFRSAVGRIDLYYLFMEQATRAVQPGGSWTFITPDKYLSSQSARTLRSLLVEHGSIRTISRFTSHSAFNDAAVVPCITTWVSGQHTAAQQRRVAFNAQGRPIAEREAEVARVAFQGSTWTFHASGTSALLRAIAGDHPRLATFTERISAGPATGYNHAFIIDSKTAAGLEDELVHPTVRGRDIGRFSIAQSDQFILVPYDWSGEQPCLIDLADYPKTRRWLTKHRNQLEARHAVRKWGKPWWDLHDPMTLPLHSTGKLLVPDVARENRFAVDDGRFVPQHSAYYLVPKSYDAHVLAAILNSAPVEFFVRAEAPRVKDGFSRYRKQYLLELPIPVLSPEVAAEISAAMGSGSPELAANIAATVFDVRPHDVRDALKSMNE